VVTVTIKGRFWASKEKVKLYDKFAKTEPKFNVHGSVHRNNILVYKSQQDAHFTEFIFV